MRSWITKRFGRALVVAAIAVSAVGAILVTVDGDGSGPPSPGAITANVWMAPTAGASPRRCATACLFDAATAYGSMAAALTSARAGDTVGVQDGSYGRQGLSGTTKPVTFLGVGPGRPSFGQLVSSSTNLTFRHLEFQNRDRASGQCSDPPDAIVYPCGASQTFDDVEIDGLSKNDAHGLRAPGDSFTFKNGSVHAIHDYKGMEIGPANSLIDNNEFHDIQNTIPSGNHTECLYYDGGSNTTISRNRFIKCPIMAVLFTQYVGGPAYTRLRIVNNVFGHPESNAGAYGACAVNFGGNGNHSFSGWIVENNTFETCVLGGTAPQQNGPKGTWRNNLGGHVACSASAQWVWSYNVGETCGGTGEVAVSPAVNTSSAPNQVPFWVNALTDDFSLKRGANQAVAAGDPIDFPPTDRDGNPRTSPPDVGAYQSGR